MAREGNKLVAAGYNPMDLKRGMDLAVNAVVEEIKNPVKINSQEEIAQVGTISSNGDKEMVRKLLRQWRKSVKKA